MDDGGVKPGESLINLFQAAQADVIHWQGLEVRQGWRMPVRSDALIELRFIQTTDDPVQGLALAAIHTAVEIAGVSGSNMVLWRDTSPSRVLAKVSPRRPDGQIAFWNHWRLLDGRVESQWGNAGIVVEDLGEVVRLCCSDGVGEVDFTDLVVEIRRLGDHHDIAPLARGRKASTRRA